MPNPAWTFGALVGANAARLTTSGQLTVTTDTSIPANSVVVCGFVSEYTGELVNCSDSASSQNVYTRAAATSIGGPPYVAVLSCFTAVTIPQGGTLTFTFSTVSGTRAVDVFYVSPPSAAVWVATDIVDFGSGTSTAPSTGNSTATTNPHELIVGLVGYHGQPSNFTTGEATNFSSIGNEGTTGATDNYTAHLAYWIVGSVTTTDYKPTLVASASWVDALVSFYAALAVNDSDAASGTEGIPVIAPRGGSGQNATAKQDTGTGAEASAISAAFSSPDSAVAAEGTPSIRVSSSDVFSGSEGTPGLKITGTGTADSGAGADRELSAWPRSSDTGTGTDAGQLASGIVVRAAASNDSGGTAVSSLTVPLPAGWAPGDFQAAVILVAGDGQSIAQVGGSGNWTVEFNDSQVTPNYTVAYAFRVLQATDTAPAFGWQTSAPASCAVVGLFNAGGGAVGLDGWSGETDTTVAGNTVTPPTASSAASTDASVILVAAEATSVPGSGTAFTWTPPAGWNAESGGADFYNAAALAARFTGIAVSISAGSGTVTPGAARLTDNDSDSFFFSAAQVTARTVTVSAKSDSDTFTGSEAATVGPLGGNDSGTAAENSTAWPASSDSGTAAEAYSLAESKPDADAFTGTDLDAENGPCVTARVSGSDVFTGSEAATVAPASTGTADTATGTDSVTRLQVLGSDAFSATETDTVPTRPSDADFWHAEDAGITFIADADTGTWHDPAETVGVADADAFGGLDAGEHLGGKFLLSDSDSFSAASTEHWSGALHDADTGSGLDAGEMRLLADSDALTGTDGNGLAQYAKNDSDALTGSDANGSWAGPVSDSDAFTAADGGEAIGIGPGSVVHVSDSDSFTVSQTTAYQQGGFLDFDSGSFSDSVAAPIPVADTDAGTGNDSSSPIAVWPYYPDALFRMRHELNYPQSPAPRYRIDLASGTVEVLAGRIDGEVLRLAAKLVAGGTLGVSDSDAFNGSGSAERNLPLVTMPVAVLAWPAQPGVLPSHDIPAAQPWTVTPRALAPPEPSWAAPMVFFLRKDGDAFTGTDAVGGQQSLPNVSDSDTGGGTDAYASDMGDFGFFSESSSAWPRDGDTGHAAEASSSHPRDTDSATGAEAGGIGVAAGDALSGSEGAVLRVRPAAYPGDSGTAAEAGSVR